MAGARKTMTRQEFDKAARGLNIRPQTLSIAREVIVLGAAQAEVAKRHGISKSAVSQVVKRIWDSHCPAGFVVLSVPVPELIGEILARFSDQALQQRDEFQGADGFENAKRLLRTMLESQES